MWYRKIQNPHTLNIIHQLDLHHVWNALSEYVHADDAHHIQAALGIPAIIFDSLYDAGWLLPGDGEFLSPEAN